MSVHHYSLVLALSGVLTSQATAESFTPIENPAVKEECSACHMAFFPEMLPTKSWEKILGDLSSHFGEDASIGADKLALIKTFHFDNAGDVLNNRGAQKWREGLAAGEIPEKITTAPRFKKKHGFKEFDAMMVKYDAKTPANCVACHKSAAQGIFEDD